jgi:hypothetical protein
LKNPLEKLSCAGVPDQMADEKNHSHQQQKMNQSAGHMEYQKGARPQNQQRERNREKGSKSHLRLRIPIASKKSPQESTAKSRTHLVYSAVSGRFVSAEACKWLPPVW